MEVCDKDLSAQLITMDWNAAMNATEYKKFHESFMQGHHGSTPLLTFLYIFLTVQNVLLCSTYHPRKGVFQYIQEYFLIILPLILSHTVLSNHIYFPNAVVFVALLYKVIKAYPMLQFAKVLSQKNKFKSRSITITCFRGMSYITTVFCILAVDFQAFPRHLAKTETYGISVMDQGVGLFVIMSGLVHKDLQTNKLSHIFKSNAKFIFVLLTLGVIRFLIVKQLDYPEHVTEYGVHWNFFFTLAVCKIISTIVLYFKDNALLMSILTLTLHEILLDSGLRVWVFMNPPRTNILDANREGITSCLGFVSLYLFAVSVKDVLYDTSFSRYQVLLKFLSVSMFLCVIMSTSNMFVQVSRVLANYAYCFYLTMIFLVALSIIYLFEVLFTDSDTEVFNVPLVVSAANNNGLLYFLVANLLTGAINLSMRTLFVSSVQTFVILNMYMLVTSGIVVMLDKIFGKDSLHH